MRVMRRVLTVVVAAVATGGLFATHTAAAATPVKFSFTSSGLTADAAFSNAPADGNLVAGRIYTDVFVFASDQATAEGGQTYNDDFVLVDVFKYKIDRRGNYVDAGSTYGFAGNDQVTFTGDTKRLSGASLSGTVDMQTCNDRGCTSAGTSAIDVSWTGTGATTTYKGSYRTSDPGEFHSTGRFSGSWRSATAAGSVPTLGQANAVYASVGSGSWSERTICHAC